MRISIVQGHTIFKEKANINDSQTYVNLLLSGKLNVYLQSKPYLGHFFIGDSAAAIITDRNGKDCTYESVLEDFESKEYQLKQHHINKVVWADPNFTTSLLRGDSIDHVVSIDGLEKEQEFACEMYNVAELYIKSSELEEGCSQNWDLSTAIIPSDDFSTAKLMVKGSYVEEQYTSIHMQTLLNLLFIETSNNPQYALSYDDFKRHGIEYKDKRPHSIFKGKKILKFLGEKDNSIYFKL